MTDGQEDNAVRRLLLDGVPEFHTSEDRLERVAALVTRRRRRKWAAASAAAVSVLLLIGIPLTLPRATAVGPAGGVTASAVTASPAPAPSPSPSRENSATPSATPVPPPVAAPGVAYVASLIPAGSAGVAQSRVTRTGALPAPGVGAFRQVCQYSHMAPADPGVDGASALMVYAGNTRAGAGSTAASIAGSGNSTCWGGTADRSAHWTNALIDVRTGTPLAPTEFSIRYSANTADASRVRAMPAGLRLFADQATWGCWAGTAATYGRPTACPADKQLVLNIWFPRCWDGTRLDSLDHHGHVVYPLARGCPADHPVEIPQLEYHVLYRAPADNNLSAWRLSNDTSAAGAPVVGYGGYVEGWVPEIRQTWTDACLRKPADCEGHLIGDGRVIEGKGDL